MTRRGRFVDDGSGIQPTHTHAWKHVWTIRDKPGQGLNVDGKTWMRRERCKCGESRIKMRAARR